MKAEPSGVSFRYFCAKPEHREYDVVQEFVDPETKERVPGLDFKARAIRVQHNIGAGVFWCPEHGPLFVEHMVRGDHPLAIREMMPEGMQDAKK